MNDKQKPSIRFKGFTDAWEQRKLKDTGTYFTDGNYGEAYPKPSDMTDCESGVPFLTGRNLKNGQLDLTGATYITLEKHMKLTSGHLLEDDIVIAVRGSLGSLGYVNKRNSGWNINSQLAILRTNKSILIGKYFIQFLLSYAGQKELLSKQTGSALKQLSIGAVKDVSIPLTSIQEQDKIGTYFEQLDSLITLHQRKYDKLVNVKKSMLDKMLPRDGKNVPEIRFAGFTEAWKQRKLSEIATMHARIGWQNLRTSEFLDTGNYMLITGTDFDDGSINYSTCHFVNKERYEQDKHIQIKNGSILITKDGTLGKVAYVQGLSMPATLNAGIFHIEIKDEQEIDNKYLFQYLKAPFLMDYVGKKATGGTIKHLNQNILVDFPVLMPSKLEQAKIARYFSSLDQLITLHQREVEKLINIKKSSLEKMFV